MLRAITLLWLIAASPAVMAHDPGISRLDITLGEDSITTDARFARSDLEPLVAMDRDYDGLVSGSEWSQAQPALESLAASLVSIEANGRLLSPIKVAAELDGQDGVHLRQRLEATAAASRLSVTVPVMVRLSPGHRQFLEVRESRAGLLSNALLSAHQATHEILLAQVKPGALGIFAAYVALGAEHIWLGLDHLLFLVTLLLPAVLVYQARRWEPVTTLRPALVAVVKLVTAFTVAHSLTLTAAVMGWAVPPSRLVEPAIALSVILVALNNLRPVFAGSRWPMAFGFGLLHGFGFASVLQQLGLSPAATLISLLGFNLGVELGQLAVVVLLLPVTYWVREESEYRRYALQGGSVAAALVASAWLLERIGADWLSVV